MRVTNEIKLCKDIRAVVAHAIPVKEGFETWRVIIDFISDSPDLNKKIKDYFVWATGEYLEDTVGLSADINSAQKFSLDFVRKRFKESGNQVPIERGVSCSIKNGVTIVNPKEYIHPDEK